MRVYVAISRHMFVTWSTLETSPSVKRKICRTPPTVGFCFFNHCNGPTSSVPPRSAPIPLINVSASCIFTSLYSRVTWSLKSARKSDPKRIILKRQLVGRLLRNNNIALPASPILSWPCIEPLQSITKTNSFIILSAFRRQSSSVGMNETITAPLSIAVMVFFRTSANSTSTIISRLERRRDTDVLQ